MNVSQAERAKVRLRKYPDYCVQRAALARQIEHRRLYSCSAFDQEVVPVVVGTNAAPWSGLRVKVFQKFLCLCRPLGCLSF